MERLSDERLARIIKTERSYAPDGDAPNAALYMRDVLAMAHELQQLRAAKAADRERVWEVVQHVVSERLRGSRQFSTQGIAAFAEGVAERVADALAVPMRITQDERDGWRTASGEPQCQGCGESWDTHGRSCEASEGAAPGPGLTEQERCHLLSIKSQLSYSSTLWSAELATLDRLLERTP